MVAGTDILFMSYLISYFCGAWTSYVDSLVVGKRKRKRKKNRKIVYHDWLKKEYKMKKK